MDVGRVGSSPHFLKHLPLLAWCLVQNSLEPPYHFVALSSAAYPAPSSAYGALSYQ